MVATMSAARAQLYATLAQTYAALAKLEAEEAGVVVQAQAVTGPTALYATADHNPLGSPRAFLNAHRRNAFPTFKRGRTIAARWTDVEAWMQDPARRVKQPANDLDEQYERLLEACEKPARRRKAG